MSTAAPLTLPIRLRPAPQTIAANFIGGLFIAAAGFVGVWGGFAVGLSTNSGWVLVLIGAPFALYGLVVAPLSLRIAVTLTDDQAVVRGYLSTARIPRANITGVSAYPAIQWTDGAGTTHSSLVNALNIYRSGRARPNAAIVALTERKIAVVRQWAGVPPV